ncbi:MAG: hypothetical protein FJ395_04515 [Verrucomicrobia bacterium]|nr:hypothetical protein [Verrucomicrobiota bacterium]
MKKLRALSIMTGLLYLSVALWQGATFHHDHDHDHDHDHNHGDHGCTVCIWHTQGVADVPVVAVTFVCLWSVVAVVFVRSLDFNSLSYCISESRAPPETLA